MYRAEDPIIPPELKKLWRIVFCAYQRVTTSETEERCFLYASPALTSAKTLDSLIAFK
jgi:hypothetical protein